MGLCADAVAKPNAAAHAEAGHDALARGNPGTHTDTEEIALIENGNTREPTK